MSDRRSSRDERESSDSRRVEPRVHWNGISLRNDAATTLRDIRQPLNACDERRR